MLKIGLFEFKIVSFVIFMYAGFRPAGENDELYGCVVRFRKTRINHFDRIITAQSAIDRNSLITKDKTIQDHYEHAVW